MLIAVIGDIFKYGHDFDFHIIMHINNTFIHRGNYMSTIYLYLHNQMYFNNYLRRQTGKLLLHLPTCKHFLMLEPDILNPGLHLNVTDSPNDFLPLSSHYC